MNRKVDPYVQCPYYKEEERQKIYCEGVVKGSSSIQTFATPQMQKDYEDQFCKGKWKECQICWALNRKYEAE